MRVHRAHAGFAIRLGEQVGQRRAAQAQFDEFGEVLQVSQPRAADRAAVEDQTPQSLQVLQFGDVRDGDLDASENHARSLRPRQPRAR